MLQCTGDVFTRDYSLLSELLEALPIGLALIGLVVLLSYLISLILNFFLTLGARVEWLARDMPDEHASKEELSHFWYSETYENSVRGIMRPCFCTVGGKTYQFSYCSSEANATLPRHLQVYPDTKYLGQGTLSI